LFKNIFFLENLLKKYFLFRGFVKIFSFRHIFKGLNRLPFYRNFDKKSSKLKLNSFSEEGSLYTGKWLEGYPNNGHSLNI